MEDDDDIPWVGPLCPGCGSEMDARAVGVRVSQRCPACGLVLLVPDPLGADWFTR